MGSPAIETAPTMTMRIEITIATMGRLMKNLDMELLSRRFRRCGIRLGIHRHARANFLHAFGHHSFARLQSIVNDPLVAHAVTGLHVPNSNLVFAVYYCYLVVALQLGYSPLRDQQRARLGSGGGANAAILSGAQKVSRVWKEARYSDRAGALVDLASREIKTPRLPIDRAIRQNELQTQLFSLRIQARLSGVAAVKVEIFLFARCEIHLDGI